PLLTTQPVQIADAITTVGQHHRDVAQHPPRIVRRAALPCPRKRLGQPIAQTDPIRQPRQQRHPRMRHQTLAVRRDFYRSDPELWLHQLGVLPDRESRPRKSRFSRPGRTFPATRDQTLTGESGLGPALGPALSAGLASSHRPPPWASYVTCAASGLAA